MSPPEAQSGHLGSSRCRTTAHNYWFASTERCWKRGSRGLEANMRKNHPPKANICTLSDFLETTI